MAKAAGRERQGRGSSLPYGDPLHLGGHGARSGYALLAVLLLLSAGIVIVGYLYHRDYERRYRSEVESRLSAIADLKVSEVVKYRRELRERAGIFLRNPSFSRMVRRYLDDPGDAGAQAELEEWIGRYGTGGESDGVFLLDPRGIPRMSIPESAAPVGPEISGRIPGIFNVGEVEIQDLYRAEASGRIFLAVTIPIFNGPGQRQPLAAVVLRIDPADYLYPLIEHWPTPSRTAETLLVGWEGNDVVFLNKLKFRKDAPLNLRLPLRPDSDLPAAKAVFGHTGVVEGRDYRGEPVLADVRAVPESPWFLVARMDIAEVKAQTRERLWLTVTLVCGLLLAAGACVGLVWRQQRARFYREKFEAERKHAWLQDIISRSLNEIYVFDSETLRFIFVNTGGLRNLGYEMEELDGKTPVEIQPQYTDESFRTMIRPLLVHEREILVFDTRHRRRDGSEYPAEVHLQLVSAGGGAVFLAFVNDITERRAAEEAHRNLEQQLQAAQRMETVGTLAGGIAHDFNNALTGIIGFGELLRGRVANDAKAVADVEEILRCGERASLLTRQILTFARRQVMEFRNVDLNQVVLDLEKLLRKVTREDIEIRTFLAPGLPTIRADHGQLEQVLMNLSLNARDAMPEGGQLVIETQETWLDEDYVKHHLYMTQGRYAVLSVSDTGIGMDAETRERIFEPFFTTKGADKGTGLGLAVVFGIVKQHKGFIHVYSEQGKGTTIRIYFPAEDAPADARTAVAQGIIEGGGETILLGEDDESIRHLTEKTLSSYGYKVYLACDGQEAVDLFRRHHEEIAMVVLDVVMPRVGGKEAYDEMAAMVPALKVLFLSGYSVNAIHDSFVLHPGIPFLQKPFGPSTLARTVREVLDER